MKKITRVDKYTCISLKYETIWYIFFYAQDIDTIIIGPTCQKIYETNLVFKSFKNQDLDEL